MKLSETMKVIEYLQYGADHATTGRTLSDMIGCDIRITTEMIEAARRKGVPICANSNGSEAGYYLADNREELADYIRRLRHRECELAQTREQLTETLKLQFSRDADPEALGAMIS